MSAGPRILVFGAGAIGSYLGAILADAGTDVTLLARGAQAAAMRSAGGVTLVASGTERLVPARVCGPGESQGRFDIVLVTLKATQLASAAPELASCVAEGGSLVMIQNGLPWWYFDQAGGAPGATRLRTLDPDGTLSRTIDLRTIVGAVIYRACETVAPGKVLAELNPAARLVIGEPDGAMTRRCSLVVETITLAGLRVEATPDIRRAMWEKLLMNLLWNPLAALTQSAPGEMAALAPLRDVLAGVLCEGAAVAASIGVELVADIEAQLKRVATNFAAPSMLQDVRAGRALELDAIVNSVVEIAGLRGVPVPTLKTIAACACALDERLRTGRFAIAPVPLDQPSRSRAFAT